MSLHHEVVELRQYTLHPGRRDELVDLFDRHFVETQEEVGIRVLGQFRDLDDPDRFVWLRSFPEMTSRAAALSAFYERHPVWAQHRAAANDTMVDSDNVLLLRPAGAGHGFADPTRTRPPVGAVLTAPSVTAVSIHYLGSAAELRDFGRFFGGQVRPVLAQTGAQTLAQLETETAANTFPALPVRTGEHVFVHVTAFRTVDAHREHLDRLASRADWQQELLPELGKRLLRPSDELRLAPTARSLLP